MDVFHKKNNWLERIRVKTIRHDGAMRAFALALLLTLTLALILAFALALKN
ncbi:MAG: hypothetical protein ACI936_003076 [Paraglaciecola sp.]|jgi:hypothetical protein